MSSEKLAAHLRVDRYGDFLLTDAIRPALDLQVVPRQGYRIDIFRDDKAGLEVPVLAAAVSAERLFETFLALLEPLGEVVDVVLETSHESNDNTHQDLHRQHIDLPVVMSHFCDYEELLLNDGCTGIAVMSARRPVEVQFDEHKLFYVYAPNLRPFQRALKGVGVRRRKELRLIAEAEHLHHSTDEYAEQFRQMALRIGVGDFDKVLSDESNF